MNADAPKAAKENAGVAPAEALNPPDSVPWGEWKEKSLSNLMAHIVEKHHAYCRRELELIEQLLRNVVSAHGSNHPELRRIQSLFAKLAADLKQHLLKEEQTLFPMIARMEEASAKNIAPPKFPFGTIASPIRMMVMEHDVGSKELVQIRALSSGYAVPSDASENYHLLYQKLKEFDEDMQLHVHLEDHLLFPRAVSLEQERNSRPGP